MQKKVLIIFLVLILLTGIISSAIFPKDKLIKKIDDKLKDKIKKEKLVKVIITDNDTSKFEKKFKIKHKLDKDKITLFIDEKDLEDLENNFSFDSIQIMGTKELFLTDSVPLINGTKTWPIQINSINLTGEDQTACILDTGADFTHPDLSGKSAACVIDCTNGCVENCSIGDFYGHGTHVAGIIGASGTLKGVAPDAKIIAVKVCVPSDGNAICYDDDIRAGLDFCVSNSSLYNISAISISLGSTTLYNSYCDYLDDPAEITTGINNAVGQNISVIVATGNSGNSTSIASPACITNSTAVGAVSKSDQIFYNRNSITDLLAPGVSIYSTWTSGAYATASGTSMATPHVTGAFLLINQFKKLESNKILTPIEIQNALNLTGKQINDSGLIFPRIDIYSAILSLDEKVPTVTLSSSSQFSEQTNVTLTCNATDELQLSNLTLQIWNSSNEIINQTTQIATSNFLQIQTEVNLSNGNYFWNCLSSDQKSNIAYASSNSSIIIGGVAVSLISPSTNTYINQQKNFTCSAETQNTLTNLTFYLWDSTNLIYNETKEISGEQNQSTFSYTLIEEKNYKWNCLAYDNETNHSLSLTNSTLTYDITPPNITLLSPANSESSTAGTKTFTYSLTETNPANCSLIINNAIDQTDTSSSGQFAKSLAAGTYVWNITCTDLATNKFATSGRTLTITGASSTSGNSGGGGGGGSSGNHNTNSSRIIFSAEPSSESSKQTEEDIIQPEEIRNSPKENENVESVIKENKIPLKVTFIILTAFLAIIILAISAIKNLHLKIKK